MTSRTRVTDCQPCAGRGVVLATYQRPGGRRGKATPALCPTCSGRGGHVRKARP